MTNNQNPSLAEQISQWRPAIRTESYAISLGELINLYGDGDLIIRPAFQRLFRWTIEQQSKFIESILLGIPIPSVFVSADSKGRWELVDGLQRVCTILNFNGVLKSEDGQRLPPSVLTATQYLPALESKRWEASDEILELTAEQRREFKRSKIQVEILQKESDSFSKFELFKRLNTGGSPASPQEVRNCIIVAIDPTFYDWLDSLRANPDFIACCDLSDRSLSEQYDMELVCRYLAFRDTPQTELTGIDDLGSFLDDTLEEMANGGIDRERESKAFIQTFQLLNQRLEGNCFRRIDVKDGKPKGGFVISMFEALGIGSGYHADKKDLSTVDYSQARDSIVNNSEFQGRTGSGKKGRDRIPYSVSIGRNAFE